MDTSGSGPFFLGVDGGGSKTLAVIVDAAGHERGRGLTGGSNHSAVGIEQAVAHIRHAVALAADSAGCHLPLQSAWLGLSGMDRPADLTALQARLAGLATHLHLSNDAELALCALESTMGIALIAGTGSIALARDRHGTFRRAGGWGYLIGDEGSGYDLGRLGLQAAVRAADGRGPHTVLLEDILQYWHLNDPGDILSIIYADRDHRRIAEISVCVMRAARACDEVALSIIEHALDELVLLIKTVSAGLDFPQGQTSLALGGGLLLHEGFFRRQLLQRVERELSIKQIANVDEPALCAARAAITLAM